MQRCSIRSKTMAYLAMWRSLDVTDAAASARLDCTGDPGFRSNDGSLAEGTRRRGLRAASTITASSVRCPLLVAALAGPLHSTSEDLLRTFNSRRVGADEKLSRKKRI